MTSAVRIVYAGTPEFAVPPLQALLALPHRLQAVLTQPDRPAGRGRRLQPSPVKVLASEAGIPVLQPESLRDNLAQDTLRALQPDLLIVVAYGQILPAAVLEIPRVACLNLHASLLPRWRGAAPIQAAVRAGDSHTGVCLMRMEAGLDTGPVYACRTTAIGTHESAGELHDRLAQLGAQLLVDSLPALLDGTLQPVAQPTTGISWAGRIHKADGLIDWSGSAIDIDRQIRAYYPWPVAFTAFAGETLRCLRAEVESEGASAADARAGTVLDVGATGIRVQTGAGILRLQLVQLPGRKPVAAAEFARAHGAAGQLLGQLP